MRDVIISADDFGVSEEVNEAIESQLQLTRQIEGLQEQISSLTGEKRMAAAKYENTIATLRAEQKSDKAQFEARQNMTDVLAALRASARPLRSQEETVAVAIERG